MAPVYDTFRFVAVWVGEGVENRDSMVARFGLFLLLKLLTASEMVRDGEEEVPQTALFIW